MIFIWGRQRVERKRGWVADYCPACQAVQPFRLFRHGLASHIFFISVTEGDLIGFIGQCEHCGFVSEVDATRYQAIEKTKPDDLERLIQQTNPNARNQGAVGDEIARSMAARAAREQSLMEAFKQVAPLVEQKFGEKSGNFDKESGLGCITTIFIGLLWVAIIFVLDMSLLRQFLVFTLAGLIPVAAIYTVIQMCFVERRFIARKVMPPLVSALKPLQPTFPELSTCLGKLKNLGLKIGQKVDASALWLALQ